MGLPSFHRISDLSVIDNISLLQEVLFVNFLSKKVKNKVMRI